MKKVLLLLAVISLSIQAQEFTLNFFSERIAPEYQEPFHQFFYEIEEELPALFKYNIHRPVQIEFAIFDYNKIRLSCHMRDFDNYARLSTDGTIQVNEKLMLPILNEHMDRNENDCTYREVLRIAISKALLGHLFTP